MSCYMSMYCPVRVDLIEVVMMMDMIVVIVNLCEVIVCFRDRFDFEVLLVLDDESWLLGVVSNYSFYC